MALSRPKLHSQDSAVCVQTLFRKPQVASQAARPRFRVFSWNSGDLRTGRSSGSLALPLVGVARFLRQTTTTQKTKTITPLPRLRPSVSPATTTSSATSPTSSSSLVPPLLLHLLLLLFLYGHSYCYCDSYCCSCYSCHPPSSSSSSSSASTTITHHPPPPTTRHHPRVPSTSWASLATKTPQLKNLQHTVPLASGKPRNMKAARLRPCTPRTM